MPLIAVTSDAQYDEEISVGKVIIDFYADWCGPCKIIAPKYNDLATKYPDIKFLKVNVDDLNASSEKAGVRAMPTFQTYHNGEKVGEALGANPAALIKLVEALAAL
ncbi:hypothetical protein BGZ73_007400 [Actinomortierella ambigua]|nr:hypothetical protein BGZ73_007400 [Actinomortierella ambigua]